MFYNFLSKNLFSKHKVKYAIKMGNVKPMNMNIYPLFKTHMDEQVQQVINLLHKRLI